MEAGAHSGKLVALRTSSPPYWFSRMQPLSRHTVISPLDAPFFGGVIEVMRSERGGATVPVFAVVTEESGQRCRGVCNAAAHAITQCHLQLRC
jgi:hypothetical protein